MKIHEVESLVGITKKNIRFYEEQGLVSPKRNSENSYREYGEAEVQALRRIKLLRKLGIPIGEIRLMLDGTYTVADGMRRHLIALERERRNLDQSILLCQQLQQLDIPVSDLDPEEVLARMDALEREGTSFRNRQTGDVRVKYVAPVLVTVLTVALMAGLTGLILWAYRTEPEEAPPPGVVWIAVTALAAVCAGVILALTQRIREIGKGEIDDAKHY